jgi:hypothetical protein
LHKNNAVNLNVKKTNMVQRVAGFLVVFLLMFFGSMNGQESTMPEFSVSGLKGTHYQITVKPFQSRFSKNTQAIAPLTFTGPRISLLNLPDASYYVRNLGFFCRNELKMDKVLAVPVRFRLGSKEYVDRMEGKGGGVYIR